MAKSFKEVQKNVSALKRAMGMRGQLQPGDLTNKARQIMTPKKPAKKLPPVDTKKGVGTRGLI